MGVAILAIVVSLYQNLVIAGLYHYAGFTPEPDFVGTPWDVHSRAEETGFDSESLAEVGKLIDTLPSDAIVVVVGGKILWEHGDTTKLSYLASVRKSVLAVLYGPYVHDGTIRLEATLEDLAIDDVGGLSPLEKQAMVRDLIAARSGVYHAASNPGDNLNDAPARGSQEPGTYYLYSNWDFNASGTAFEKMTGQDVFDALEQKLAKPLGFEHWVRAIHMKSGDSDRSEHMAYHMHLSTRDMARIGELMLRDGKWDGVQLIPAAWTKQIVSVVTPNSEMNPPARRDSEFGYGYMWWVWDGPKVTCPFEGSFTGRGAFGQFITVLPKLDMVIAHKTVPSSGATRWNDYLRILDALIASRRTSVCS